MRSLFAKVNTWHFIVAGILLLIISWIPNILLGIDSIVPYHDQLDGEIIAYIYQAKYLFSDINNIPEFLNGAPSTSLTPPAPLAVLFFYFFTPFTAYLLLQMTVQVVAFLGMFFLIKNITKNNCIAFITAILYTFLPFLPVYGLAHYGAPLLLLCFYNLFHNKKQLLSYIYIAFYAGMSSLVLIGFAWIFLGFICLCILILQRQFKKHFHFFIGQCLLLTVYLFENFTLITQILGMSESFVSHKSDYTLNAVSFFTQLGDYILSDNFHIPDWHIIILIIASGTFVFTFITRKQLTDKERAIQKWLFFDILFIFLLYTIATIWDISPVIALRKSLGALGALQLSRFTWITPVFWYIALALSLVLLWSNKSCIRWLHYIFSALALVLLCFLVSKTSFVKPCVQELLLPNYDTLSWSDYYAIGVMEQVEDYIYIEEGLTKEEYKVASLGIDPCAALYHEFYCVDGYSNNYPLSYKIAFRPVIADELEKSPWLKSYYDDWGNRCYLHAFESMGYYNIEKRTFYYTNLELNTDALYDLGCDYILSSSYIVSPEKMNLTLLREEPFDTDSSYYNIYIYKIEQQ